MIGTDTQVAYQHAEDYRRNLANQLDHTTDDNWEDINARLRDQENLVAELRTQLT